MADTPISGMTAASALSGTEVLAGLQSGANRKISVAQIKALLDTFYQAIDPELTALAGLTSAADTNYWKCNETAAGGNVLVLTFSPPISAFGFYGTDVGDFGGSLTLTVRNSSTLVSTPLSVGNTIGSGGSTSGCLLFFGFKDKTATYDRLTFTSNGSTADFFGFDDIVAAVAAQVI